MNRGEIIMAAFALVVSGAQVGAQQPRLASVPSVPLPGALVTLTLSDPGGRVDRWSRSGTMAGGRQFVASRTGHRAVGAMPVDSVNTVEAAVVVTRASGRSDALHASVTPPPLPPPKERAAVASRFGRPLDARPRRAWRGRGALALAVGRRAHDAPPRWTAAFLRPRASDVDERVRHRSHVQRRVASRHLGVDYRGALAHRSTPPTAASSCSSTPSSSAGGVVYLDHGGGITTGYLHLSSALVAVGDTVARGQRIGLVGATGRVTGPHLHWTARYGALTVNPLDSRSSTRRHRNADRTRSALEQLRDRAASRSTGAATRCRSTRAPDTR